MDALIDAVLRNVEIGADGIISILASPPVRLWDALQILISTANASTTVHYTPYRDDGDPVYIRHAVGQDLSVACDQEFTGSVYIPHPYINNVVHWYKELV